MVEGISWAARGLGWWDDGGTNHVEGHDIFEGDAAGFVGGDEEAVDDDWAGAGGKTEDEGVRARGIEVFDSVWEMLVGVELWEWE